MAERIQEIRRVVELAKKLFDRGPLDAPDLKEAVEKRDELVRHHQMYLVRAVEAGEKFLKKVKLVGDSDAFKGVFALQHVHGGKYTGESWAEEQKKFEDALKGE